MFESDVRKLIYEYINSLNINNDKKAQLKKEISDDLARKDAALVSYNYETNEDDVNEVVQQYKEYICQQLGMPPPPRPTKKKEINDNEGEEPVKEEQVNEEEEQQQHLQIQQQHLQTQQQHQVEQLQLQSQQHFLSLNLMIASLILQMV